MCCVCCCRCERGDDLEARVRIGPDREEFYQDVERDAAEDLLRDRQCGTFIIRPSKSCAPGTLSLVQDGKIFHLNIRRRHDGMVALGSEKEGEKCFRDVNALINYYISNYLVLYSKGEKTTTLLLPYREKSCLDKRFAPA